VGVLVILLDSPVLIWAVADSKRLSKEAASAIRGARRRDGLAVSAITIWEIARLLATEKVSGYGTTEASLRRFLEGVTIRPITEEIAVIGAQFPEDYPPDPADRIIGGTARAEGWILVTADERIRRSPLVRTLW